LRKAAQFQWLAEIERLLMPGGIALVTTHGIASVLRSNQPCYFIFDWLKRGFVEIEHNPDLKGAVDDPSEYVNTLHTEEYIRKQWSYYLKVLGFIPGYIGNHQDLVLLQKPEGSESTHCRTGTSGNTRSTQCAAVSLRKSGTSDSFPYYGE
jgi:hypothetical protein